MLTGKTALITGSTSGIGLGIAKTLATHGANIVLNGFGDVDAARREFRDLKIQIAYHPADMSKPEQIADMMALCRAHDGPHRHPGQQRRHPARGQCRRLPDREVGRDHRHQPDFGVPHDAAGPAGHESAQLGSHPQHRVGSWPGGLGGQERLRRRQARPGRLHQGRGAGDGHHRRHRQRHLPRLGADAAGAATGRCARRQGRRRRRRSQAAAARQRSSPRCSSRRTTQLGELALFLCSPAPTTSAARPSTSTAAGPRSSRRGEHLSASSVPSR